MEFERRKKVGTYLNIAPLIDIVFLLLIFFMLSSRFVARPGIRITLPRAVTAERYPLEEIVLYITRDNTLYINEERVTCGSLLNKLELRLREAGNRKDVIIKADEKAELGFAVKVMDIAKQAGSQRLIISTQTQDSAPGRRGSGADE